MGIWFKKTMELYNTVDERIKIDSGTRDEHKGKDKNQPLFYIIHKSDVSEYRSRCESQRFPCRYNI